MKPLLISSGEPAGIGPDLCLQLAPYNFPCVILGDRTMLSERAEQLGLSLTLEPYRPGCAPNPAPDRLTVLSIPSAERVTAGRLNAANAGYVIEMLRFAVESCLNETFSGLVTAPIHKGILNEAGFKCTGHTEFLAEHCGVKTVVMMLAARNMKVALVTTHLPIRQVAEAISETLLIETILCVWKSLQQDFGIPTPRIFVAGLNPHAGESGYLGREEIEIFAPAIAHLTAKGLDIHGPLSADTLFTPQYITQADAFVTLYHDQGLPVLKYASFGQAVNITLGLPIVRTSVDHGTALSLAGTGQAEAGSLVAAIETALDITHKRSLSRERA